MIRAKPSAVCEYCGAKGEHFICVSRPPYPRIPMAAFAAMLVENGESVTENVTALPKRGRPRKADKLTAAEKQRAYRERKKHGQAQ